MRKFFVQENKRNCLSLHKWFTHQRNKELAAISFSFNFGLTLMLIFFLLLLCDLFAVYIKYFFVCYVIFTA